MQNDIVEQEKLFIKIQELNKDFNLIKLDYDFSVTFKEIMNCKTWNMRMRSTRSFADTR